MVWNVHLLRYLWEVREELPGNRRQKKQILSRVESSVLDFVIENPDVDYDAITRRFGTPQQIATSCIEEMNAPELTQQLRIKKRILRVVGMTAVMLVLLWAGLVVASYVDHRKDMNGYLVVGEASVIERNETEYGGN